MAALTEQEREFVRSVLCQDLSTENEEIAGLTKADLLAAVQATDQWIDDNAAAFNAALPLPARTALTQAQKVRLFMLVARRRFEIG